MIGSLVALALAAAPVAPPSLEGASATLLLARLDRMGRMVSFLDRAGQHSVLFRPASWQGDLHPLLSFDPTRPDSVSAAGIDPAGGLSISVFPEGRVTCVALSDPSRYEPPAQARLAGLGAVGRARDAGASVVVAAVKGHAVAGYVIRGRQSCATEGPRSEELLRKAAKALARPPPRPPWASAASAEDSFYAVSGSTTVQLTGKLDVLEVRGSTRGAGGFPGLRSGDSGLSPYGGVAPSGLLLLRARVTPDGVRQALGRFAAQLLASCEICNADVVGSLTGHLRDQLTGEVMLRVDRVKTPPGSLRSGAARYFSVKHAYLAEVSHPEVVSAALESLMKLGAVRAGEDAYTLSAGTGAGAGTLLAGLSGRHLYLANDEEALKAALDAVAAAPPAPLEHGADLFADPRLVSRALAKVSLVDLMSSRDLAPLVAVGTELGPLLTHSERLAGWIDGDGKSRRFSFTWKLATQPPPDAGAGP